VAVACYGLTFKADIDDMRESPAVEIVRALAEIHPGRVLAIEPNVSALPPQLQRVELIEQEAAEGAQVHALLVDHKVFRQSPPPTGETVDARGIWGALL
jgi:UDP-N-acetyl-D-mannosaminuronic acid dehydrogenase